MQSGRSGWWTFNALAARLCSQHNFGAEANSMRQAHHGERSVRLPKLENDQ
jgi:hypothetical protein